MHRPPASHSTASWPRHIQTVILGCRSRFCEWHSSCLCVPRPELLLAAAAGAGTLHICRFLCEPASETDRNLFDRLSESAQQPPGAISEQLQRPRVYVLSQSPTTASRSLDSLASPNCFAVPPFCSRGRLAIFFLLESPGVFGACSW